jgi:hypothetical protein
MSGCAREPVSAALHSGINDAALDRVWRAASPNNGYQHASKEALWSPPVHEPCATGHPILPRPHWLEDITAHRKQQTNQHTLMATTTR